MFMKISNVFLHCFNISKAKTLPPMSKREGVWHYLRKRYSDIKKRARGSLALTFSINQGQGHTNTYTQNTDDNTKAVEHTHAHIHSYTCSLIIELMILKEFNIFYDKSKNISFRFDQNLFCFHMQDFFYFLSSYF